MRLSRRQFIGHSVAAGLSATVAPHAMAGAPDVDHRHGHDVPGSSDNLLRNGRFQDDWLSLLPQPQTLHWAYAPAFYNRRDFNPDGWRCAGSWEWADAAGPRGARRLILAAPRVQVSQRVHWFAVHDDQSVKDLPDAGGFPQLLRLSSPRAERLVRDLTLRVRVKGVEVPANAGSAEIGLGFFGQATIAHPLGTAVPPIASRSAALPSGTFDWRWIDVRLPASAWLDATRKLDPGTPADERTLVLPAVITVAITLEGAKGRIEVGDAGLTLAPSGAPNLLPNGRFGVARPDGYPAGWSRPAKYRYFPPRGYYLINTWHNALFDNRGIVEIDGVVKATGAGSMKMVVPAGDEVAITSPAIVLEQREPRLIEVSARVKTDRVAMLAIDGLDERGDRIDGFHLIHKAPVSIGTDDWRELRQVFRPRQPLRSVRVVLAARGVNGYTLDATGFQPQNNVVGTVWWDEVRVVEPESTTEDLAARGLALPRDRAVKAAPHLDDVDLGERLLGRNVLVARVVNPGPVATFRLHWEFTAPSGRRSEFTSAAVTVPASARRTMRLEYLVDEACERPYTEYRGRLALLRDGKSPASTELWFSTWATFIDVKLGALYLRPEQKTQLVRVNLGFSVTTMADVVRLRLDLVRRGSRRVIQSLDVSVTASSLAAQRTRIPSGLRGDLTNLVLADLDVSALPVQPFAEPGRNWLVRVTALTRSGRSLASAESEPFCRQDHAAPQPPIRNVAIGRDNILRVDDESWMPWGAIYGFAPTYEGPANPTGEAARDLRDLPEWSMYDRFTAERYTRRENDFNCARDVAGSVTSRAEIERRFAEDNRYSSSVFVVPAPAFSTEDLARQAGGEHALAAYLDFCKRAPMVVATAPGLEEAFGLFHAASAEEIEGLRKVVDHMRRATGKPVMVGHGGFWNRFELEKAPFFDVYDPETEPFHPANLHTDLWPLVQGQAKVIWLRPQMYEDVPYERWRFHVYTELMRGCRGWQIAHGPGDASLVRGLHGEIEFMRPVVASSDPGPAIRVEPWLEHWSRRFNGKTYLIVASTRGMAFGRWRTGTKSGRVETTRITAAGIEPRGERNPPGIAGGSAGGYAAHGVQYLPAARSWPSGSRLSQWVRLDPAAPPSGFAVVVKGDGRFTHAASWGRFDAAPLKRDPSLAFWFLRTFYPHAIGFLGWDTKLLREALPYVPDRAIDAGRTPPAGSWVRIEMPLARIEATGKLVDGVGFIHSSGRMEWGRTSILGAGGEEAEIWDGGLALPPERLARTRISVAGLAAGTRVRVLFEDRDLIAADGYFVDDFCGRDLYQRFGGGPSTGYGDDPVALRLYEIG